MHIHKYLIDFERNLRGIFQAKWIYSSVPVVSTNNMRQLVLGYNVPAVRIDRDPTSLTVYLTEEWDHQKSVLHKTISGGEDPLQKFWGM